VTQISSAVRAAMYTVNGTEYAPGLAIPFNSPEGTEHYRARGEQKNAFEAWLDAEGLDVVVWPMYPNKTPTGGTIIGRDLVNFMYLPSVTVPMGVLQHDETRKEPLTMNFTGRLYDDPKVLSIAYAYEQATKHRYAPPLAPPLPGEVFEYNSEVKGAGGEGGPQVDEAPPVLSIVPAAAITGAKATKVARFSGIANDLSGVDRIEVTVAGVTVPVTLEGNRWIAVLPAEAYAELRKSEVDEVTVMVLAVDPAGNASSVMEDVKI
jgi:hypothetical protein